MGLARPIARIAVIGPSSLGAEVSAWRGRLASELPLALVSELAMETLTDVAGHALELDTDVAILMAPDSRGETNAKLDVLMRSIERGAGEASAASGAGSGARIIVVGDPAHVRVPELGVEFIPRTAAERELVPFVRGMLACLQGVRATRRELSLLGRVVDSMRGELEERNEELLLAALVQKDFLPLPLEPLHGVRVTPLYRPLAQVSGDVYHLEQLDNDRISVFLADAVGHGIPAALLGMAVCRSLETADRVGGRLTLLGPGETLARANRRLYQHQRATTRFATAAAGVLDCRTRRLTIACAGHPPAILLRPGEEPRQIEADGGLLGVFPDEIYSETSVDLKVNDRILLYSDGFEQAFSDQGTARHLEEFGRLSGVLDPEELVNRIAWRVDAQSGSLHQQDDLTLLCISVEHAASMRAAA